MASPRALIEAKPENPGRIVVIDADRERHIALASLSSAELTGLVAELRTRGYEVEAHEADVEAQTPANSPEAALRTLGLSPPYRQLEAAKRASSPDGGPAPS